MRSHSIDRLFLINFLLLVCAGFLIFISASLGLLARDSGAQFGAVALKQIFFGLGLGGAALLAANFINYQVWRKYSFYFFISSLLLTLLVFVPGIGFAHGGARRWLSVGSFSFQPSEFLK